MKIFLLLIFVASASGIFITCRFNFDNNWGVIGRVYTCDVTSMNFSDNSTHITDYNGTHLSGNSSANVGMILFPSKFCPQFNLTTIPKGFLNFFPNFIGIFFDRCSISSLNGDELDEYPNLQWYGHNYSNLTRIPGIFFASTPNMKYVNFNTNQIQHVGDGLLDNLQNLHEATFQWNTCINKQAWYPSEIPRFIAILRQNCPDIEPETTTTNQPPRCEIDDLDDFVCGLDEEIKNLKEKDEKLQAQGENLSEENLKLKESNENLQNKVESLNSRNEALESNVETLNLTVEDLKLKNEALEENVKGMREKLENQSEILLQLEQMVIELYSRPCAC